MRSITYEYSTVKNVISLIKYILSSWVQVKIVWYLCSCETKVQMDVKFVMEPRKKDISRVFFSTTAATHNSICAPEHLALLKTVSAKFLGLFHEYFKNVNQAETWMFFSKKAAPHHWRFSKRRKTAQSCSYVDSSNTFIAHITGSIFYS